ncbi:MAG TPA: manganese efflux pump MntP family protein, partial [Longimicrobiales bacterium]
MGWFPLLALAVALAMDAFAVAIVTAVALDGITERHVFRLSFHFGLFQAAMLALGWLFGSAASALLSRADHWIAFGLLAIVGARMIWGATHGGPEAVLPDRTRGWDLVMLSVATSIDALAVGLTLALIHTPILVPALVVGGVA